jgi:hypothetical protein
MDSLKIAIYRVLAENKYLKLKRTEFQAWIVDIMKRRYPIDFVPVRLTQGDHQLDGILMDSTALAVYAPRETTRSIKESVAKIDGDFEGARSYLKKKGVTLERWIFVDNDPDGVPAEVAAKLLELRQKNPKITIERWGYEAIWNEIMQLDEQQLEILFGPAPTRTILEHLQFAELAPVIAHLRREVVPNIPPIDAPAEDKLSFNKLPEEYALIIRSGRLKVGLVGNYFSSYPDPTLGEKIAQAFRERYRALKGRRMSVGRIFEELWAFAGGTFYRDASSIAAVAAVLTYLFDSCDIFENPTAK